MSPSTLERRNVPQHALRLACAVQFAATEKPVEIGKPHPVRILARSVQPFFHWFWGQNVHDFAGMSHKPRIALDHLHNDGEIIGYADAFSVAAEGLWLDGALVPFAEHDRAAEILVKSKAGIPYEASIFFDPVRIEELTPGATTVVNGNALTGPATIFREWELVGCAICPHGYDPHTRTETELAKTTVCFFQKGKLMSADTNVPDTPAPTVVPPAAETPPADTTPTPPAEPSADALTKVRAEAKRFTDAFGPAGAQWYLEGKTFDQCALAKIKELDEENAKLKQRLSAPAPSGETTPATFNAPPVDQQTGAPAGPNKLAGTIVRQK